MNPPNCKFDNIPMVKDYEVDDYGRKTNIQIWVCEKCCLIQDI